MRSCGYCGRENDEQATHCRECGSSLAPAHDESTPIPPRIGQQLNAGVATLILLAYLGVQFCIGALAGVAAVSVAAVQGRDVQNPTERTEIIRTITAPATAFAFIVGGVTVCLISRSRIRPYLSDTTETGAAWVFGSLKHIVQGLGFGALVGFCCQVFVLVFCRGSKPAALGPLATAASTPGIQRWAWLLLALALAPVFEELLFRGVLYGGYRSSFGPARSAILTTAIFWVLHLGEMIYFWPSMLWVAGMAIAALWFRLRSAAIGPAVAVHFGYNAVLAACVIYSVLAQGAETRPL